MGRTVAVLGLTLVLASCGQEQQAPEPSAPEPVSEVVEPVVEESPVVTTNSFGGLRRTSSYSDGGFVNPPAEYWRRSVQSGIAAPPVVHEGSVLVATVSGQILSIHSGSGAVGWVYAVGEAVAVPPVAAADAVYAVDVRGGVHAIDAMTGLSKWVRDVDGSVATSPGVTRNRLFVVSESSLTVFDRESGEIERTFPVEGARNFAVDGGVTYLALTEGTVLAVVDGEELWRATTGSRWRAGPILLDDTLLVASADGRIVAFSRDDGGVTSTTEKPVDVVPNGIAAADLMVAASADGLLRAYSPGDLTVRWSYRGVSGFVGAPSIVGSVVYAVSYLGEVAAVSAADGVPLFSFDTGTRAVGSVIPTEEGILVSGEDGTFVLLAPGNDREQPAGPSQDTGGVVRLPVGESLTREVPSERDLFLFAPGRDGTYQIRLPDQASVEMVVDLYDSDGVQIASNLDKVALESTLTHRLTAGEEYLLEAYPVRDGLSGRRYSIEVSSLRQD